MPADRFLIVGFGSIGARHARVLRALRPSAQIAVLRHRGCADGPPPGTDRCVGSIDEALAFGAQAAVIANPATLHVSAAVPLARAGVHLLIEKPLSVSLDGLDELDEARRRGDAVVTVGYNLRFSRSLQRFRDLVKSGRVGRILSVRAEVGQYLPSWRPAVDYRTSVSAQSSLGGGVLLELSHELDYLRWIFGEVAWVQGVLTRQSNLEIDVEDTALLTMGFVSPTGPEIVAHVALDFVRHDTVRGCIAIGETGTLRWNAITGVVDVFEKGAAQWVGEYSHQAERDEAYLEEWRVFLAAIETGADLAVTFDDAVAVLRIIDAARRSAASRAMQRLSAGAVQ